MATAHPQFIFCICESVSGPLDGKRPRVICKYEEIYDRMNCVYSLAGFPPNNCSTRLISNSPQLIPIERTPPTTMTTTAPTTELSHYRISDISTYPNLPFWLWCVCTLRTFRTFHHRNEPQKSFAHTHPLTYPYIRHFIIYIIAP